MNTNSLDVFKETSNLSQIYFAMTFLPKHGKERLNNIITTIMPPYLLYYYHYTIINIIIEVLYTFK